jgi:hypothetical protein
MRKRLLIENDISELDDFRKILLLNKKKINSDDVEFIDSDGDYYRDIIEITPDGIVFNFDDLEQFLKFFFRETYAEGSDSEWDARVYDIMYYNQYDFSSDCYDRSSDEWSEGYILYDFCDESLGKLKELMGIIAPSSLQYFSDDENRIKSGEGVITSIIDKVFKTFQDEATEIICNAKSRVLSSEVSDYIEKTFCNGLEPFGIVDRKGSCFNSYFMPWSSLIQMYLYDGDFSKNALDVMFNYIDKNFKSHPPAAYEIENEIFDSKKFEEISCEYLVNLVDEYIESALEEFNPEYIESMNKLAKLNLFNAKLIPGTENTYMKVKSVDTETLQTKYVIGRDRWMYDAKYGSAPVDEVISMVTQPGLFDQTEFRVDPTYSQR